MRSKALKEKKCIKTNVYIPKSGIAGSNGRSMSSFLSSLQIFFHNGILCSHEEERNVIIRW
jgi:hypothetical protein